ncbi:MAG: DUF6541 family protein [Ornithinibacter sp.]
MIPAEPTSWLTAFPVFLVAVVVLLLPGWVASMLLGVRGFLGLACAPVVTITVISCGAILTSSMGMSWSVPTFLGWAASAWALAWALGTMVRRRRELGDEPVVHRDGLSGASLLGLGISSVLVTAVYVLVTRTASAFPQQPDTIFHLGTIRSMLRTGDASSLHAAGYTSVTGTGFYPAAFHDVAVTVSQLTGTDVAVAASVVALAVAALVWPAGVIALTHLVVGPERATSLAAGVTAASFVAFPTWFLGYGVLWPLLLGFATVPAALAAVVAFLRPDRCGAPRVLAAILALVMLPGVALAHPGALFALVPMALLAVAERVLEVVGASWRGGHRRSALLLVGALITGLAVLAVAWAVLTRLAIALRSSNSLGAETSAVDAALDAVTFSSRGSPHLWVLSAVTVLGVAVLVVRWGARWMVASLAMTLGLYLLIAGYDTELTRWLTWPWYNNTPRFAAMVVVPAAVVAAAGLALPGRLWSARRQGAGVGPERRRIDAWMGAVLAPLLFVLVTGGANLDARRDFIERYFKTSVDRSWASPEELASLRSLARRMEPNGVVAANPWNGATYLPLVSDRQLLLATEKSSAPGDRRLLATDLSSAAVRVDVCAAMHRQNVRYVITGGRPWAKLSQRAWRRYGGIDGVSRAGGFEVVAKEGPFTLWRVPECS